MKLYLSSYRIPVPDELAKLLGKSLDGATMALIPNAEGLIELKDSEAVLFAGGNHWIVRAEV